MSVNKGRRYILKLHLYKYMYLFYKFPKEILKSAFTCGQNNNYLLTNMQWKSSENCYIIYSMLHVFTIFSVLWSSICFTKLISIRIPTNSLCLNKNKNPKQNQQKQKITTKQKTNITEKKPLVNTYPNWNTFMPVLWAFVF